jgi:hypothetical protein
MACGLPVIVTRGGGTDEFCDDRVGWGVPATPRSVGQTIYGQSVLGEAFLLEPERAALIAALRAAYEEREQTLAKGVAASVRAQAGWSWTRSAAAVGRRLDSLVGTEMSWHLPHAELDEAELRRAIEARF